MTFLLMMKVAPSVTRRQRALVTADARMDLVTTTAAKIVVHVLIRLITFTAMNVAGLAIFIGVLRADGISF